MQKRSKIFNKIEEILIISLLIIIPLYPKFPLLDVPGTYVAIRIEDILIAAMFIYLVINYIKDSKNIIIMPITMAFILYFVIGTVSLMYSIMITNTTQPLLGTLHLLRRVQYIAPFFLGYFAIRNNSIKNTFILKTLMLVVFIVLLYGLGQKYWQWPIIITQNSEYAKGIALRSIPGGHLNSTFAGHYDLASYMILVVPMFIVSFAKHYKAKKFNKQNLITLLVITLGIWLIGISGSRISTVSFMGSGIIALLLIRRYKLVPFFIILSVIIFSFSSSLITRYQSLIRVGADKIQVFRQELISDVNKSLISYAQEDRTEFPERREQSAPTPTPVPVLEDRSTSIRLNIEWPRAIRAFRKNPLTGTGLSSITLATDNDYLRLIGELGIFGFMAFTTIFLIIGTKLLRALRSINRFDNIETGMIVGFTASLFGIFLNATFIDIFEASKFAITFWLLLGVVLGTIDSKSRNENK